MNHATPAVLLVFSTLQGESIEDQHHDPLNKSFSRWWCWGRPCNPPKWATQKGMWKMRWGQERDRTFRSSTGRADVQSCKNEVKPSTGQPRMGDWKWCSGTLRAVAIKRRTRKTSQNRCTPWTLTTTNETWTWSKRGSNFLRWIFFLHAVSSMQVSSLILGSFAPWSRCLWIVVGRPRGTP